MAWDWKAAVMKKFMLHKNLVHYYLLAQYALPELKNQKAL